MSRDKPRSPAWRPAPYEDADVYAIKALAAGTASEGQQRRALDWICKAAAGRMDGNAFRSDADGGERETAFALGRQFVAEQIIKLADMPGEVFNAIKKEQK